MHSFRSFAVVMLVLLLVCFTACHKVQPATQANEDDNATPQTKPIVVAANRPVAPAASAPAAKNGAADLTALHLEVTALETIHQLQLTRAQLDQLARIAPTTAHKGPLGRPATASDDYQKALKDLRDALVEEDEDHITDLSVALDELREKEEPDFAEVEITDAAGRQTAALLRGLSARQVMSYLAEFADEFPDPLEKLTDTFDEIRKESDKDWEALRDEVAGQVAWLVAGLDRPAEDRLRPRVKELLARVRKMKDDEYTARKAELDKAAQALIGNVGPTDVIRHFTERSLAELLSNPRLAVAVEALRKKAE